MSLPRILSAGALEATWRKSRDSKRVNSGAPGVDRVLAVDFGVKLRSNIAELRLSIRKQQFTFRDLRIAPVPKPSGGFRIIAVPTVRDRLVQRALLGHLEADIRFPRPSIIAYGFCKGRTLSDAQRQALMMRNKHHWVLQADIVKFFDNIPREEVKRLIQKHVRSKVVSSLLCAATDCELENTKEGNPIASANGIRRGHGLRQGMPISPVLSNLILRDFDTALAARSIAAVRYADDIAIFADSRQRCRDALTYMQDELAKIKLDIPDLADDGKTVCSTPSESAEFLGVELRRFGEIYKLVPSMKKLRDIEKRMGEIASLKRCEDERQHLGNISRSLDMFVIGHSASMQVLDDPSAFLQRLNALKQNALKRLITELLGQEVFERLDSRVLAILGATEFAS